MSMVARVFAVGFLSLILSLFLPSRSKAASEKSVNDIIRSLAPIDGQIITKGYGKGSQKKTRVENDDIILDYKYTRDLEIYFPFDSAKITKRARKQLNILGRALTSSELKPFRYLIAGHTDAKGTRLYNFKLSRRRAIAAKNYLYLTFAIPPWRLKAIGWGEDRLKSHKHPRAAVNRRVQIVLIVSPRENGTTSEQSKVGQVQDNSEVQGKRQSKDRPDIGPGGKLKIEW